MKSCLVHQLVGFDRETDLCVVEHDIEKSLMPYVKEIAHVACGDPDAIGSYPLDQDQASAIAKLIGQTTRRDLNYGLEPHTEEEQEHATA